MKLIRSVVESFDPGASNDWANLFIRQFGATTLLLNRSSCQMNDYFCGDFCQQHKVKHFKSDEVGLKDSDEKVWATVWNVKIEDFQHINIARETRERVAQILWKSDKICTSRPRHNQFSRLQFWLIFKTSNQSVVTSKWLRNSEGKTQIDSKSFRIFSW